MNYNNNQEISRIADFTHNIDLPKLSFYLSLFTIDYLIFVSGLFVYHFPHVNLAITWKYEQCWFKQSPIIIC